MKAAVMRGIRDVRIEDIPVPPVLDEEARLLARAGQAAVHELGVEPTTGHPRSAHLGVGERVLQAAARAQVHVHVAGGELR